MPGIKEKYEALKKKYSLPAYDDINKDFDIESIDENSQLVLQKARANMVEKLDYYAKLIESILQPESNLSNLYEAHYITDDDKNDAYSLFKRLMRLVRYSNSVSLTNGEEENAKFIKEAYQEYNGLRKDILKHIIRLMNLWEKETDIKDDQNYFG